MNAFEIEEKLENFCKDINTSSFIYDLLVLYDIPKASITRLQKGNLNLSKVEGELDWKKKVYFKSFLEQSVDLHVAITSLKSQLKHDERFVIVTDFKTLLATDTKTSENLETPIKELYKHYDFFLPWAGIEKTEHKSENPADVKAAVKMAKLFDEIKADNPELINCDEEKRHDLNTFLTRLLFCFFAECTGIFEQKQFTNALDSETQKDGSDLHIFFERLYEVLDTKTFERKNLPEWLNAFPYVNGKLFTKKIAVPHFTFRSRNAIIAGGELDWSAINPDILGSMFQAVISAGQRSDLGQHYTSVPNIMKVIEPLFLNNLRKEFELAKEYKQKHKSDKKLDELLHRLSKIKIFDPACGSGNFLIIAYKELCRLEMEIIKVSNRFALSEIKLENFYGIEIDDFACEISQLSLYLAEHQMNMEFKSLFGRTNPTLPLQKAGHIVKGNAIRLDWKEVCPISENDEIYLLGNPPYKGARKQTPEHKADIKYVFENTIEGYSELDYITCWFYLGAMYCKSKKAKLAFVTTNSVCQGEQVGIFWQSIFSQNIEIGFSYASFKWKNNAMHNAGVTVIIICLQNKSDSEKLYFTKDTILTAKNINAYNTIGENLIIKKRSKSLSHLPEMVFGSMPNDKGNFLLSSQEKKKVCLKNPEIEKFIKKFVGADDFINGDTRYCFWITDKTFQEALLLPELQKRISAVEEVRKNSTRPATRKLAQFPYRFGEVRYKETQSIIIPRHSSEKRIYIPMGFLDRNCVIGDSAISIYNAEPWLFAILTSKMHMLWLRTVGGKLEERLRYSAELVYNTFPVPVLTDSQKQALLQCTLRILTEREKYFGKTLAYLYNSDTMPESLLQAHKDNDYVVEQCYRTKPFESDEERLEYLFKQYKQMLEAEQLENTLFENGQKKKRR